MASFTVPCPKVSTISGFGSTSQKTIWQQNHLKQTLSINRRGFDLKDSFSFGSSLADSPLLGLEVRNRRKSPSVVVHALNEVIFGKSSNSVPAVVSTAENASSEGTVGSADKNNVQNTADESSISAFMNQVSDLIKLVDSRDIMELQLKQQDCEIIIRKKDALQPPASSYGMLQPPPQAHAMYASPPPPAPAPAPAPASSGPSSAPASTSPVPAKSSGSSHPPLKCPMAGTFYRCPGPGEPPFVKVGDKVQKGQVICIIEAMKLMNEIEADQSGTISEILAEDGKPVSIDTPLLVIVP